MGGEHDVADERETHAGAGRDAVDRDHHRHGQPVPGAHHRVEMLEQARTDARAHGALRVLNEIVAHEIGAGAEGASRAGEQHGANLAVGFDQRRRGAQLVDQFETERVQSFRPVERYMGDAFAVFVRQGFELHAAAGCGRRPVYPTAQ
jgi:hypothetical protein